MKKILLIIALIFLMALNVFAQTGSYTSHDIFYLPLYGAYGTDEYDQYNTYMEIADQLIWDNKTAIEAIEADYLVAADLTGYYTKLEIDAFGYITDAEAVTAIKADEDWNATEWDLAYGWGNHALEGYLTAETDPSFVDWSVSQAPNVIHADNYTDNDTTYVSGDFTHDDLTGVTANEHIDWTTDQGATDIHSGNYTDTNTTYTAGTGLDLTGTVFSLDASAFDLSDFPADPNDDRYLFWNDTTGAITWAEGSGSGVTTFVGLTDTPLNYTGYAGYFPKVNAGATALEFAELTESDISDLGTYLTDITGESIGDLSDVDLTDIADTKILQYNISTSKWECETAAAGGGASELSDLSDVNTSTPTNKYVLVADGVDFESRLLVEADISDLGSYLENIVDDTTPELGGELDAGANSIGFTLQTVAEADGTTTIDWKLGNHCKVTLGAQAETFTFTAPSNPCNLTLIVVQDATGGRDITWPATVKWLGTEATWTDGGASKGIVVGFIYDGTNYWGQATPWEN